MFLTQRLGIEAPILQAPMAGVTTPAMVAAASNAGGLGNLACAVMQPDAITAAIAEVRNKTDRAFGVNLFITPTPARDDEQIRAMQARLNKYRQELGVATSTSAPTSFAPEFAQQFDAVLAARVPVFSFTFGALDRLRVQALRAMGTVVIGTATTTKEACALEVLGCDAIVAQGIEAGGHRGTFLHPVGDVRVGLVALVQQASRAVRVPVIAAGALASGRAVAAMQLLGAAGGAIGSLFLRSPESHAADAWKLALADSEDTASDLTQAFSGRHARGITNRVMRELADASIPPYPQQNALTRDIRDAAGQAGRAEFMSLWCGQCAGLATAESTDTIMRRLIGEWREAVRP